MQNVVILGSTGSIGCNTLEVISLNLGEYKVFALTANTQVDKLIEQCIRFKPKMVVLLDQTKISYLDQELKQQGLNVEIYSTTSDLVKIVQLNEVDIVMSAIVGSRGLLPTYQAIKANKKVLLANKESLIAGGKIMIEALKNSQNGQIIPVDSEHSAIFQSLPTEFSVKDNDLQCGINKIILTASGGPFRKLSYQELESVTAKEAILHPNWVMGKKISVDSSTLMNKGLEVIEAFWLFGTPIDKIEVVIHPQSIIHSMVEYIDGSLIAQLGTPDMKTPIAYALSYPQRIISGSNKLDFKVVKELTFEEPDYDKFPCLGLAFKALKSGGAAPAILNAANEIAVEAFLNEEIKFYDIAAINQATLDHFGVIDYASVEEIVHIDNLARDYAKGMLIKS